MKLVNAPLALSPLAVAQAGPLLQQTEDAIRADLLKSLRPDYEIDDGFSHVAQTETGEYLCWPGEGGVYVDAVEWEEGPVLDAGAFKGKRVVFPRAASLPRERGR